MGTRQCNKVEKFNLQFFGDDTVSVSKYEVGTFDDLKSISVKGDELDIHHVGQKHTMGQVVPDYN